MNNEFNNIDFSSKLDYQINKKKYINIRHNSNFSITGDFKKK
jgi:hypothetical protein